MIILSFESKNKAREYFNFILSNASIKTETIILNDFAYQYDYEMCIDLLYSKSDDFLYNYEMFRVYVRVEDKKVLIFAENEIDFNNGIRILKSGDNKIFFEYVADNEFHKKTVNDIIELMKEKEENHE